MALLYRVQLITDQLNSRKSNLRILAIIRNYLCLQHYSFINFITVVIRKFFFKLPQHFYYYFSIIHSIRNKLYIDLKIIQLTNKPLGFTYFSVGSSKKLHMPHLTKSNLCHTMWYTSSFKHFKVLHWISRVLSIQIIVCTLCPFTGTRFRYKYEIVIRGNAFCTKYIKSTTHKNIICCCHTLACFWQLLLVNKFRANEIIHSAITNMLYAFHNFKTNSIFEIFVFMKWDSIPDNIVSYQRNL